MSAKSAARSALRSINKYGDTVAVVQITAPGVYDNTTEKLGDPTTTQTTIKALVTDIDARMYGAVVNLALKSGDKMFLIAANALPVAPSIGDTFTMLDGSQYTVVPVRDGGLEVLTVSAQDTNILYKVHGRKA